MLESFLDKLGCRTHFSILTKISKPGGCDCTLVEYEITGTGETEIDSRCLDIPNDPFGGLGCNACNRPDCRLCGFGDYPQCGGALNMP